jgi:hypothetical protein
LLNWLWWRVFTLIFVFI